MSIWFSFFCFLFLILLDFIPNLTNLRISLYRFSIFFWLNIFCLLNISIRDWYQCFIYLNIQFPWNLLFFCIICKSASVDYSIYLSSSLWISETFPLTTSCQYSIVALNFLSICTILIMQKLYTLSLKLLVKTDQLFIYHQI